MNTDVRLYILNQTDPLAEALCRVIGSNRPREIVVVETPAQTPAKGPQLLTPRECEIAGFIRAGKSNREIATVLCISERTVETHVSAIFGKLEVNSRVLVATHPAVIGLPVSNPVDARIKRSA